MEGGSGEEIAQKGKRVVNLQRAMTKKVVSFEKKIGSTISNVAAPGDTNPSDTTA